jgi:glycosyltransferase involved in cell wall biosynthesis
MTAIKYSVLIPCYQTDPKLLSRCLKSILITNRADIEVILVEALHDGKSSFGRIQLTDPRLHCFVSSVASAPYQRNLTLSKATGDFLVFVDSDDYISPQYFNFLDSALSDFSSSDLIVMSHSSDSSFYEGPYSKNDFVVSSKQSEIETWFSSFKKKGPVFEGKSLWAKAFKRSIVFEHHLQFDLNLKSSQDHFFVMRYLSFCKEVAVADKYKLYHFDISPFSMSPKASTNSPERYRSLLDAWDTFFNENGTSNVRIKDWAYNVSAIYLPRMLVFFFFTFKSEKSKKDLRKEFKSVFLDGRYKKAIQVCSYSSCLNFKKKIQLFLLKCHFYNFYFNFFWRVYREG